MYRAKIILINYFQKAFHKKSASKEALNILQVLLNYLTSINSTSNIRVASGGITPPAPLEP